MRGLRSGERGFWVCLDIRTETVGRLRDWRRTALGGRGFAYAAFLEVFFFFKETFLVFFFELYFFVFFAMVSILS